MSIVNRRNAVVGWLTLKAGKAVARRKAKAIPGKLVPRLSANGAKSKGRAKQTA